VLLALSDRVAPVSFPAAEEASSVGSVVGRAGGAKVVGASLWLEFSALSDGEAGVSFFASAESVEAVDAVEGPVIFALFLDCFFFLGLLAFELARK